MSKTAEGTFIWREIMTPDVATLTHDLTISQARDLFLTKGHGAYPVVDDTGALLGMIGRRELLSGDLDPTSSISAITTSEVLSVGPGDHAIDALHLMVDEQVEHILVLDAGRLVGICTRTDLLKVRREQRGLEQLQPGILGSRGGESVF